MAKSPRVDTSGAITLSRSQPKRTDPAANPTVTTPTTMEASKPPSPPSGRSIKVPSADASTRPPADAATTPTVSATNRCRTSTAPAVKVARGAERMSTSVMDLRYLDGLFPTVIPRN